MSTMTLLPCPFCGGEPEIVRAQDEDGRFAAVGCPHCGAGSRQHYFVGDDAVPHVVSAWNRRAHLAQPAQAVVEVYRMGNGLGSLVYTDYGAKSDLPHGTKLYLHAERARVPHGWRVHMVTASAPRPGDRWEVYDASGSGGVITEAEISSPTIRRLLDALAAAPSQPEDAA